MNRNEAAICFSTEILIVPSKVGLETTIFGNGTTSFGWTEPTGQRGPTRSWNTLTAKFVCGPKRSIHFSTEISGYFDIRKALPSPLPPPPFPPPPTRRIPRCPRQRSISYVFHHCVLTKRSSYFVESMKSPEIKRGEVIATCFANVYYFFLPGI